MTNTNELIRRVLIGATIIVIGTILFYYVGILTLDSNPWMYYVMIFLPFYIFIASLFFTEKKKLAIPDFIIFLAAIIILNVNPIAGIAFAGIVLSLRKQLLNKFFDLYLFLSAVILLRYNLTYGLAFVAIVFLLRNPAMNKLTGRKTEPKTVKQDASTSTPAEKGE